MKCAVPWICASLIFAVSCGRNGSQIVVKDQGSKARTTDNVPERTPLAAFRTNLNGFHAQSANPKVQVEEQRFCAKVTDEINQCLLFDGTGESAHLTGVEYVVSRRMFESFQPDERKLWHSHAYEVRSGQLIVPGLAEPAEREIMKQFAGTFGKTWHTWHSQLGEQLPTGLPDLMTSFTSDDQLKPELLQFRDERLQVSTADKRSSRSSLPDSSGDLIPKREALRVVVEPVVPEIKTKKR